MASIKMEEYRVGDNTAHRYWVQGDERVNPAYPLPSCSGISQFASTFGGDGLMHWAIKLYTMSGNPQEFKVQNELAKATGTALHAEINEYCETNEQPVDASSLFGAWYSSMMENGVDLINSEMMVYNPGLFYGGTLDGIGELDGVPTIFDWKTTDEFRYPTDKEGKPIRNKNGSIRRQKKTFYNPAYAAQLGGYALALDAMPGPIIPQQGIVVYIFKDTNSVRWERVDLEQAKAAFETCSSLYWMTKKKTGEGGLYA
jgi:hypothetical protein